ncbi:coiled-coil domain-containing protein 137 [Drosophila teissieri]|uniref:coiled-coil domain-containing protein 137 n=1 Tax=Drosophila teissieri TaxID=7243 RepID=UPI001CBA4FA3|nr:coiled-coil domain-containing protein 137 [Drosophila teissieri]
MARKRKIPVRKHHGVRDPLKQLEQKEKKLSKVTNNPPVKKDEQQVSFKFRQFQQLANATKSGKKLRLGEIGREDKPKSSPGSKPGSSSSSKEVKNIKQFANETDEDYLQRVNRMTNASVREAHYEAKYGVNVIRNPKTGEITVQKRPKNEIDELLKQKQKEQRLAGKRGRKKVQVVHKPMDAKTSRELVKRAYKEAQQEVDTEEKQNAGPTEFKQDVVAFGEIVHAPPSLKILPRKAEKSETVPRPGRKANLLLKSMLDPNKIQSNRGQEDEDSSRLKLAAQSKSAFKAPTKAQMKGKRKDLPLATRSMLETERSKMVQLYRQLKNKTTADS